MALFSMKRRPKSDVSTFASKNARRAIRSQCATKSSSVRSSGSVAFRSVGVRRARSNAASAIVRAAARRAMTMGAMEALGSSVIVCPPGG